MIPIPSNPWGELFEETVEQRERISQIGVSDIERAIQFVLRMTEPGTAYDLDGRAVNVTAQRGKRFFDGGVTWDAADATYMRGSQPMGDVSVRATAEMVVANMRGPLRYANSVPFPENSRGYISRLMQRLAFREIDVSEWYSDMQSAVKYGDMAAVALARGGWSNVRDSDFERSSARVFEQLNGNGGKIKGLRDFAERIARGSYGDGVLEQDAWSRAGLYGNPPRAVYENEHVLARFEVGHTLACRLLAAVEHCRDCIRWAADGWIFIELMMSERAIGMADCNYGDHCRIVTRRANGRVAASVDRAIERARKMAADDELVSAGRLTT